MAYSCVHSSACYIHSVQKFTFRPVESGDVSHTGDSSASASGIAHSVSRGLALLWMPSVML